MRSQSGQADDTVWRGYKYQQSGALEEVMKLADSVPTAGLDPTNTTWAQVQAMGQAGNEVAYLVGVVVSFRATGHPRRQRPFRTTVRIVDQAQV